MRFIKLFSILILLTLLAMVALGQNPAKQENQIPSQPRSSISRLSQKIQVTPQAGTPVQGSGTPGQLAKWTGVDGSNSYSLGNSAITEDKFGKVGIGTTAPTSKLTVQGMIETTLGGYKFPDGTIQTSAFSPSQVVSSLNGLKGDVQLVAGANLTITPNGNTLTLAASGVLAGVTHDATLTGNGTQASPLGVAVPLGLVGGTKVGASLLFVQNSGDGGNGAFASGGSSVSNIGGDGVIASGGSSSSTYGGNGVYTLGGNSISSGGGTGLFAVGGNSSSSTGGAGLFAVGGSGPLGDGDAGIFGGDVDVNGNLDVAGNVSKGGGSFKIDHPLDPENKYLYHSFVESPDMKNIYDGNITTDENGEAVVDLPDYFEALNRDFRYQLTVIGTFAQAIVADEIKGNRFRIKTSAAGVKVSWQVTGIRQDAYANKHRIQVEEQKSERERGFYLYPEAHGQSEERGIEWARRPQVMQQLKQSVKQQKPVSH